MAINFKTILPDEVLFHSSLDGSRIKGSYTTFQFVLRLRNDVRKEMDRGVVDDDSLMANSTAIHENIHWWQGIGSNLGFMVSLSNIGLASMCIDPLKGLIEKDLKFKSLIKFDVEYVGKNGYPDINELNLILNSYYDFKYAKMFLVDNKLLHEIVKDTRFFLNIGHSYRVLWSKGINTIASIVDRNYEFLPNESNWESKFRQLEKNKVEGFYIDSSMTISELGIRAIFEGQAAFNQYQYLTIALSTELTYQDFIKLGMLHGVYLEAFQLYLKITGYVEPVTMIDPIVGLFLLICDISINPTNGFPLDIYDYEGFITKNDPGIRFTQICFAIKENSNEILDMIKGYTKDEYVKIESLISKKLNWKSSYASIQVALEWLKNEEVSELLKEEEKFTFLNYNFPVRLLLAKYLKFQEDKFVQPEVFCWFGLYASSRKTETEFKEINDLYKKHHALFVDDYDNEIKPVLFDKKDEKDIYVTFNTFYKYLIFFDMIEKWIVEPGPFKYDYKWISNTPKEKLTPDIKDDFKKTFNISPDEVKIID